MRIGEEIGERREHSGVVGRSDEYACGGCADCVGDTTGAAAHDRQSHRTGLDDHDPERLDLQAPPAFPRDEGEHVSGGVVLR